MSSKYSLRQHGNMFYIHILNTQSVVAVYIISSLELFLAKYFLFAVLEIPYIEGRITGQILEFNCSTGQKPLGQTVEIVANDRSQFTMAHFNTSCIRKHVECTPNECACTSNWFQWKTTMQNPSILLKVQCLMRFPDNKRETVKATIAFNGSCEYI